MGLEEGIVFETENPHYDRRFLLRSWSERGREEQGRAGKQAATHLLLLARVWGEGLALSSAPHFRSSCCRGAQCLIAPRGSCAGVEERFQAAPPCPSARVVIPSHFLPQEDVSKAEEMFLNKTGEP